MMMKIYSLICVLAQAALSSAQIDLGTAATFGALSAASITNTGPTVVTGDIGTSGSSITGFPPGVFTGGEYISSAASTALSDAQTAYDTIISLGGAISLAGNLGGRTLGPGTYRYSSSAQLTGTLILAGTGSPNDAWYFQVGSTLLTSVGAQVILTGGGLPCRVWWQVGSSSTLGVGTSFAGTVLAHVSITLNSGATTDGGLFALGGSITLNTNDVTADYCYMAPSSPSSPAASSTFLTSTIASSTSESAFPSSTLSSSTTDIGSSSSSVAISSSSSSISSSVSLGISSTTQLSATSSNIPSTSSSSVLSSTSSTRSTPSSSLLSSSSVTSTLSSDVSTPSSSTQSLGSFSATSSQASACPFTSIIFATSKICSITSTHTVTSTSRTTTTLTCTSIRLSTSRITITSYVTNTSIARITSTATAYVTKTKSVCGP